jgi:membrane-associated phospholipid phosphatase
MQSILVTVLVLLCTPVAGYAQTVAQGTAEAHTAAGSDAAVEARAAAGSDAAVGAHASNAFPQAGASADTVSTGIAPRFVSAFRYGITAPSRWNANTLVRFAGASAAIAGVSSIDGRGREAMLRNQSDAMDAVTSVIEPLGMEASFGVIAAFAVAGMGFHNAKATSVAADAAASSVIAGGIITPALKWAIGRPRPREGKDPFDFRPFSGEASFPSGHTTQAFAIASVIATEYDAPWVRITAYSIATGVGISRMYHGAHYASDVVTGAIIGGTVGRSIARRAESTARRIHIYPAVTGGGGAAIVLRLGS